VLDTSAELDWWQDDVRGFEGQLLGIFLHSERVGLVVYEIVSITQYYVVLLLTGFFREFREFLIAGANERRQTVLDKLVVNSTGDRS
jgi:hypothetical protein